MRFASFLARGEQYRRLDRQEEEEEDGALSDGEREGDRALLLCKSHQEEQLSKRNSRLRTFASPWRWAAEPLDGTMNLLIRRMDNTTFVVNVRKRASMSDLKEAIEKKFQASGCQVSWPHVWGHFCLSFRQQKLLEEHLILYKLGIEELDELVFVRHFDTRPFKDCQQNSLFNSLRRKRRAGDLKC